MVLNNPVWCDVEAGKPRIDRLACRIGEGLRTWVSGGFAVIQHGAPIGGGFKEMRWAIFAH